MVDGLGGHAHSLLSVDVAIRIRRKQLFKFRGQLPLQVKVQLRQWLSKSHVGKTLRDARAKSSFRRVVSIVECDQIFVFHRSIVLRDGLLCRVCSRAATLIDYVFGRCVGGATASVTNTKFWTSKIPYCDVAAVCF